MLKHRRFADLDGQNFGWLNARYHFAVSPSGNQAHKALGPLIVWNDDEVAAGTGFPMHGHKNVEIITFVRQGAVSHADSTGGRGRTNAGDVQIMSAGTGIRHEEYNHEDTPLKMFQIWLQSNQTDGEPHWQAKPFPREDRSGNLVTLASGFPEDRDALRIRADARVMAATLRADEVVQHVLRPGGQAYLVAATGEIRVNGESVGPGDGVAISELTEIVIEATTDAEVVVVEVL